MIRDRDYWERRSQAISSLRDLNRALAIHETSMSQLGWMKVLVQLWVRVRNPSYEFLHEHEVLRQSRVWFSLSTLVSMVGFALITTGSIYAFSGQPLTGILVTISSVIPNTVAIMFYANHKYANARADAIYRLRLKERERLQELGIVESIYDPRLRDNAKVYLLRNGNVAKAMEQSLDGEEESGEIR